MGSRINWGIIGCGYIANHFATALLTNQNSNLVAVASASSGRAKEYAATFNARYYYDNYCSLLERTDIDVVYVANCTSEHKKSVLQCIEYGKAVLCEKPLTINLQDTKQIITAAKKKNVFLMEGMWMRFHPAILKVKLLIDEGMIGSLRMIKADFGFKTSGGPEGRHLNPKLAGGAILDVGIYPLTLANYLFNKSPIDIKSTAYIGSTGVDEVSAYLFTYDRGEIAMLSSAVNLATSHDAEIIGTKGKIVIPDFWHAQKIILSLEGNESQELYFPFECNGFEYEIKEVVSCLKQGEKESKIFPQHETIRVASIMDEIRRQWNLYYPGTL